MNNFSKNVIRNEDDAWKVLELWLDGKEIGDVEFEGWPILSITLNGGDYQSSLNSGQMAALLDFKSTIGRTYSVISHGAYDMRRLREEEEEQLQFNTEVKKGSSIMDTDLTPLVQALSSIITAHPGSSIVAGIVIGLALVAKPIILKHYENRAKQLEIEERERLLSFALNNNQQRQNDKFEEAVKKIEEKHPQFSQALPDARHAFWRLASASVNADTMTVSGIQLTQEDLQILAERRNRRPSDVKEITKIFRIEGVRKTGASYRIQLSSKELLISAIYKKPQLSDSGLKKLINYMTTETFIRAVLEIRTVDKSQMAGRLLRFAPIVGDTL